MKIKDLLLLMFLALFSCLGIIGCDLDDDENSDVSEIRICEVSAHKVMKEIMLFNEKVSLPCFELTTETGRVEYIVDSQLENFEEYEEGFIYTIKLKITLLANPPADGSSLKYYVLEVLSKREEDVTSK